MDHFTAIDIHRPIHGAAPDGGIGSTLRVFVRKTFSRSLIDTIPAGTQSRFSKESDDVFRFLRGASAPRRLPYRSAQAPLRLDDARLAAWALALGQHRPSVDPPPRPHRGMLPDVDFSLAVPAADPGLIRRFVRIFLRRSDPERRAAEPAKSSADTPGGSVSEAHMMRTTPLMHQSVGSVPERRPRAA